MGRETPRASIWNRIDQALRSLKDVGRRGGSHATRAAHASIDPGRHAAPGIAAGASGFTETTAIDDVAATPDHRCAPRNQPDPDRQADITPTRARSATPSAQDRVVFAPGELFAERYRIVTLLGHGGMGDVYRADDLRVGQPVALKFLAPRSSASPSERRERFIRELQMARRIAHPGVCRVHDIADWKGRLYLSMEYIDGENLWSLLRRVGRLPADKALDVAHQLCAGLEAAHEQGVLHLDLKPANVMIDGRGRALITDFGVARSAGEEALGAVAGTPAYMPPEQRRGGRLSVQSDLYALGLVMFEMFTGHRAGGPPEPSKSKSEVRDDEPPSLPSRLVPDLDPRIEGVILACLERDVASRPRSALEVAAGLPGGEPLAAAIAAGRIPSPEAVAATRRNALRPAIAGTLAASLLVGVSAIGLLNRDVLEERAPRLSPPVLVARAQDIIRSVGYADTPADSAYWFTWKGSYRTQAADRDASFRLNEEEPAGAGRRMRFVYRQGPGPLLAGNLFGRVLYRDPPAEVAGMVDLNLDIEGRLLRLCAVSGGPGRQMEPPRSKPDWDLLLDRAGLRLAELSPVAPISTPPVPYDTWTEWEVRQRGSSERFRATTAALGGRPVYFDIAAPADSPLPRVLEDTRAVSRLTSDPTILFAAAGVGLLSSVLVARRHLRRGLADRRGASRVGLFFFWLSMASAVLWPDHVAHFGEEYFLVAKYVAWGLYWCAATAVVYMAFEPSARLRWPELLIGWNRLLAGRFGDPIVGRDLLVGTVAGTAMVGVVWLAHGAGSWLHLGVGSPMRPALEAFREPRHVAALAMFLLANAVLWGGLGGLFALVALRRLLRARWLALAAWTVAFAALFRQPVLSDFDWIIGLPAGLATATMAALVLARFGLVAMSTMAFTSDVLTRLPAALEFSAWYANRSLIALAIVVGIGLYGARAAVAGGR